MVRTITAALNAYIGAVGEPYYDFKPDNILYDAATGLVAFIDLGLPTYWRPPRPGHSFHEVSLGTLMASVVFETARPRHVALARLHRQIGELAVDLVAAVRASGAVVRAPNLLRVAEDAYLDNTLYRGGLARTAWYATVGFALGRRLNLPDGKFAPVPAWRAGREH
jgi:hypothetical protein